MVVDAVTVVAVMVRVTILGQCCAMTMSHRDRIVSYWRHTVSKSHHRTAVELQLGSSLDVNGKKGSLWVRVLHPR